MKKGIRMIKSGDNQMKTIKVSEKIEEMHRIKKMYFCNLHKMFDISVETFPKNYVYTIKVNEKDNESVLWIRMINIQKNLRYLKHL